MGVVEYPRARAVELARGVVAPQQYPSQPRLCFGRPVRRRGEAALRLAIRLRPALPRALHQSRAILGVPVAAPELPQLRRQSFVQRCEMGDVLFGIFELAGRERALQPVRTGFVLGDRDAEQHRDQFLVAEARAQSAQGGGDLGIEQVERDIAKQRRERFHVLARAVHHAGTPGDQRAQVRAGVEGQRVDQPLIVRVRDLHQRKLGEKGVAAHELGVEPERGVPAGAWQGVRVVDPGRTHGRRRGKWCSIRDGFAIVNPAR